ncbi:hypothetical protein V5O48_018442 [Marasmius crinis-equi]|uniref:Uncharacterized protein n=1 Tax=Marasmius crinis-equi TaxID=585013 RepID=A0ABR3EL59_9AGAR
MILHGLLARTKAPSLARLLREGGPFDKRWKRDTRGQIFSALLFRGILYDTDAMRYEPDSFYFKDYEEWRAFRSRKDPKTNKAKPEAYFCNPGAYGATKGRKTQNAKEFWEDALILSEELKRHLDKDGKRPFVDVLDIIKKKLDRDGQYNRKRFYTFGSLSGYLLCVDLAEAGLISPPSLEQVADIVAQLDRGWCSALRALGCVDERVVLREEFITTFNFLDARLTGDHKRALGWNFFVFEHGGCKYIRFYRAD